MTPAAPTSPTSDVPSRPLTPRALWSAARESGGLSFSAGPAVFLLIPAVYVWAQASVPVALGASAILVVYAVLFVLSCALALYPRRARLLWLLACTALVLALIPLIGMNVLYMIMFQAMTQILLLPWRRAVPSVIVLCLGGMVLALALGELFLVAFCLMALLMSLGIGHGIRQQALEEELQRAQRRNAVLAVAAERERIGRDLHDILGHSLTSLTISAQLAQKLLDPDPAAARAQLEHIEQTARQALADVRATSSGMRTVRAATEIAAARTVLTAVGIEAETPSALPPLPEDRSELFGYVIREATTNIVRHAQASSASITLDEQQVRIADDGIGIPETAPRTGLAGLARRVHDAGGALHVDSTGDGTVITASLRPEEAPHPDRRPTEPPAEGAPE